MRLKSCYILLLLISWSVIDTSSENEIDDMQRDGDPFLPMVYRTGLITDFKKPSFLKKYFELLGNSGGLGDQSEDQLEWGKLPKVKKKSGGNFRSVRKHKMSGANNTAANNIVGGAPADPGMIHSIVSIRTPLCPHCKEPPHVCGGTLLSKRIVLTAAHCCINGTADYPKQSKTKPKKIHQVWAGGVHVNKLIQKKKILKMAVHPKADGINQYDLCMLKVQKFNLKDKRKKKRVSYAELNDDEVENGRNLVVAGWGANYYGQNSDFEENLQYLKVKKMKDKKCKRKLKNIKIGEEGERLRQYWYKGTLCTKQKPNTDSCQGDSGGPLFAVKGKGEKLLGKEETLVGVVSWGPGCARKGLPAMYVDVHYFKDWIQKTFRKLKK